MAEIWQKTRLTSKTFHAIVEGNSKLPINWLTKCLIAPEYFNYYWQFSQKVKMFDFEHAKDIIVITTVYLRPRKGFLTNNLQFCADNSVTKEQSTSV